MLRLQNKFKCIKRGTLNFIGGVFSAPAMMLNINSAPRLVMRSRYTARFETLGFHYTWQKRHWKIDFRILWIAIRPFKEKLIKIHFFNPTLMCLHVIQMTMKKSSSILNIEQHNSSIVFVVDLLACEVKVLTVSSTDVQWCVAEKLFPLFTWRRSVVQLENAL